MLMIKGLGSGQTCLDKLIQNVAKIFIGFKWVSRLLKIALCLSVSMLLTIELKALSDWQLLKLHILHNTTQKFIIMIYQKIFLVRRDVQKMNRNKKSVKIELIFFQISFWMLLRTIVRKIMGRCHSSLLSTEMELVDPHFLRNV